MYERDGHAALAHGRRDALDRARPHIAAREDARYAGLEEIRVTVQRPAPRRACTSGPVSTKPRRSSSISRGSHPVSASAPMKMNSPLDAWRETSPFAASRTSPQSLNRS